jgi:hypothetical protein
MALTPITLDDLTWADFNAAALQRIPAASGGRWTLNAPVDPGMTLLDLFAWLLEQRVYWMDQVSDPLTRALMSLLGITPMPAQAATTVLYVEPEWDAGTPFPSLSAGTQVRLAQGLNPPIFTTRETITLYPLRATTTSPLRLPALGLIVGASNQTNNLGQGRPTALLDAAGGNTQIVLTLAGTPTAGTLSLFFELSTPPGVEPDWSPTSAKEPPGTAALTWSCSIDGKLTPLDATKIVDGTHGLRRSGIVQLPIPAGWTQQPNSTTPDYAVVLSPTDKGATFPARVTRIVPNAVSAVHSRPTTGLDSAYIQGQVQGWRRLPGNVFTLPPSDRPALASTLTFAMTELNATASTTWQRVDDLSMAGPDETVFVLDAASAQLRFGNGITGKLPIPKDAASVTISYSVGGGSEGNLGSCLAWAADSLAAQIWNIVPAAGGTDEETLAAVRERAPEVLKPTGRAITQSDFEALATLNPGTTIARARASIGRHPSFPKQVVPGAVTVFLVPDLPRNADGSPDYGTDNPFPAGPVADQPTIAAVQAALNTGRMVTSEVYVDAANYRPVTIGLTVQANPTDPQALRDSLYKALQAYLDPLVGGDEGDGWPFGGPVRPSTLLRIAQTTVGSAGTVQSVKITLQDDPSQAGTCADVLIGADDLVELTQVNVALQRPPAGQGGLR